VGPPSRHTFCDFIWLQFAMSWRWRECWQTKSAAVYSTVDLSQVQSHDYKYLVWSVLQASSSIVQVCHKVATRTLWAYVG